MKMYVVTIELKGNIENIYIAHYSLNKVLKQAKEIYDHAKIMRVSEVFK